MINNRPNNGIIGEHDWFTRLSFSFFFLSLFLSIAVDPRFLFRMEAYSPKKKIPRNRPLSVIKSQQSVPRDAKRGCPEATSES